MNAAPFFRWRTHGRSIRFSVCWSRQHRHTTMSSARMNLRQAWSRPCSSRRALDLLGWRLQPLSLIRSAPASRRLGFRDCPCPFSPTRTSPGRADGMYWARSRWPAGAELGMRRHIALRVQDAYSVMAAGSSGRPGGRSDARGHLRVGEDPDRPRRPYIDHTAFRLVKAAQRAVGVLHTRRRTTSSARQLSSRPPEIALAGIPRSGALAHSNRSVVCCWRRSGRECHTRASIATTDGSEAKPPRRAQATLDPTRRRTRLDQPAADRVAWACTFRGSDTTCRKPACFQRNIAVAASSRSRSPCPARCRERAVGFCQ